MIQCELKDGNYRYMTDNADELNGETTMALYHIKPVSAFMLYFTFSQTMQIGNRTLSPKTVEYVLRL